jgi:hypothetical protein
LPRCPWRLLDPLERLFKYLAVVQWFRSLIGRWNPVAGLTGSLRIVTR